MNEKAPKYFYRVEEFMTTFGMDVGKHEPFKHQQDFKGDDLLKCKQDAEKYYYERREGLESSSYFLPFRSAKNFKEGEHAAFSITLLLVEWYIHDYASEQPLDGEHLYPLMGDYAENHAESREIEKNILRELGY